MTAAPFSSPLAEELAEDVLERFLRYVRMDTQAAFHVEGRPSTAKQLDLSRLLVEELREIGLEGAELTDSSTVFARLPGTAAGPAVGLIAHVDTTPDAPGAGVTPIVHEAWDGTPIVLPGDERQVLDPAENPELAARVGHVIVTSDGTTLLGGDDKAGIAEIMAGLAYLARRPERTRAPVRVAFTVDEEVGRGADGFDIDAFGALAAYTLDGSGLGGLEVETFSAASVRVTIRGVSTHPGTAKEKLVNALKLTADLVGSLPRDGLSPETTEDREGFVHPHLMSGTAEEAYVDFMVRDHEDSRLEEHIKLVRGLAESLERQEPRARVELEVRQSYRNIRPYVEQNPLVVDAAFEAMRRAGVEPRLSLIRGGTDGSILSSRGLPTPNLFAGGQEYHSLREWASLQDMAAAAATVVELAGVWAELT